MNPVSNSHSLILKCECCGHARKSIEFLHGFRVSTSPTIDGYLPVCNKCHWLFTFKAIEKVRGEYTVVKPSYTEDDITWIRSTIEYRRSITSDSQIPKGRSKRSVIMKEGNEFVDYGDRFAGIVRDESLDHFEEVVKLTRNKPTVERIEEYLFEDALDIDARTVWERRHDGIRVG